MVPGGPRTVEGLRVGAFFVGAALSLLVFRWCCGVIAGGALVLWGECGLLCGGERDYLSG